MPADRLLIKHSRILPHSKLAPFRPHCRSFSNGKENDRVSAAANTYWLVTAVTAAYHAGLNEPSCGHRIGYSVCNWPEGIGWGALASPGDTAAYLRAISPTCPSIFRVDLLLSDYRPLAGVSGVKFRENALVRKASRLRDTIASQLGIRAGTARNQWTIRIDRLRKLALGNNPPGKLPRNRCICT